MSAIDHIISSVENGPVRIGGLVGSAKAYLLGRLCARLPKRTILAVSSDEAKARALIGDLEIFRADGDGPKARLFPESDVLPYLKLSPEPVRWADRIEVLHALHDRRPLIISASVSSATRVVPGKGFIAECSRTMEVGQEIDRDELTRFLITIGYTDVGLVEDEGSFAVRGGIVDLWTPTLEYPIRLEFDGDRLSFMREFDPATQRSKGEIKNANVIPADDICFTEDSVERALASIRERAEAKDFPAQEKRRILDMVRERIQFPGIETLCPLFHESCATIFDYLPDDAIVVLDEPEEIKHSFDEHLEKIRSLQVTTSSIEAIIEPDELHHSYEGSLKRFKTVEMQALEIFGGEGVCINIDAQPAVGLRVLAQKREPQASPEKMEDQITPLAEHIHRWKSQGLHAIFVCHTKTQADRLVDLFRWHGLALTPSETSVSEIVSGRSLAPSVVTGRLSGGVVWPEEKLAVVTDEEIFGRKIPIRSPKKHPIEHFTSFAELSPGDLLVHETHGIGRYTGLKHLSIKDMAGDYLLLEYLGGDKLYLPVYRMNLIQRYVGSGETLPPLDRLGGTRWQKVTSRAKKQILAMAKDLLKIHASREIYPGYKFPPQDVQFGEFCAAFPYDETPDQASAIDDVMRDMETEKPMDRLICGDVGYGKTEVAMRAAFKAAMAGKQVALLVPTTILAFQHYESFTKRFANTPIKTEMLSRFVSAKDQKRIVEELKRGSVDVLIGTHRLISKDVQFRDLGLVIIDEEQRFGVKHKELLKKLKETVDVMTLTATPIPRTLQFSLVGIRDISVINTPPADRLSITTHVVPFDEAVIRHAILEEIGRGGQVFFVHNRVQTMPSMLARLKKLVPEAKFHMAHGQMPERELEDVMIDFVEKKYDVLLCSAIIESGLDIPAANTIIINRADTFGLAQLYQLRGRVGRSNVKAYAYLVTPEDEAMTTDAKKRLMVLKRFTELGSGFQIATHDLEIRGAGNFLGSAQSGHIAEIGYELYTKLLARTIRNLTGKPIEEEIDTELKLKVEAFLPESFVAEAGARLDIYKRLSSRSSEEEIDEVENELKDRFGELPPEARRLIGIMKVRLMAQGLKIRNITFDGKIFSCQFDASTPLDPVQAAALAQREPNRFKLHPPDRILALTQGISEPDAIVAEARNFLSALSACVRA